MRCIVLARRCCGGCERGCAPVERAAGAAAALPAPGIARAPAESCPRYCAARHDVLGLCVRRRADTLSHCGRASHVWTMQLLALAVAMLGAYGILQTGDAPTLAALASPRAAAATAVLWLAVPAVAFALGLAYDGVLARAEGARVRWVSTALYQIAAAFAALLALTSVWVAVDGGPAVAALGLSVWASGRAFAWLAFTPAKNCALFSAQWCCGLARTPAHLPLVPLLPACCGRLRRPGCAAGASDSAADSAGAANADGAAILQLAPAVELTDLAEARPAAAASVPAAPAALVAQNFLGEVDADRAGAEEDRDFADEV